MRHEASFGVLLFQNRPRRSFLILLRGERVDLPKGKRKAGEDDLGAALRELEEETGIGPSQIRLVEDFRFFTSWINEKRSGPVKRTVTLFAAEAEGPCSVVTPDHDDYAWLPWDAHHALAHAPMVRRALDAWRAFVEQRGTERRRAS